MSDCNCIVSRSVSALTWTGVNPDLEMTQEQGQKWALHCFASPPRQLQEPQYSQSGTGNTLQDGLVWQNSARMLSRGEALQQTGWDKAAYPQGHSNVMACAANLLLAIQHAWLSSKGGNHVEFQSFANWLLLCIQTLNSVPDLGRCPERRQFPSAQQRRRTVSPLLSFGVEPEYESSSVVYNYYIYTHYMHMTHFRTA